MKLLAPKLICFAIAFVICCISRTKTFQTSSTNAKAKYVLTVERGAFNYDSFVVTNTDVSYLPKGNILSGDEKYNTPSRISIDNTSTLAFFKEIERKGFWDLENKYTSNSSCLSRLNIRLEVNGKSKTVICDNFERDCPDLVKYIDRKVVELEGNNLKRIYLPG